MEEVLNEDDRRFGIDLKIILLGNISTGKTSIINRYINNTFETETRATITPSFLYKIIKKNNTIFRLQFWDLPGQERNPIVTSLFSKDSDGVIFCCEVKNDKSRKDILKWEESLKNNIDIENLPIIVVENKCDLLGNEEMYNENIEELKKLSDEHNFSGYFRTSALNGYNIDKAINLLIDEIIKNIDEDDINVYKGNKTILNESKSNNGSKRCC